MRKMCSWSARRSWYHSHRRTVRNPALGSPSEWKVLHWAPQLSRVWPDTDVLLFEVVGPQLLHARPFGVAFQRGWQRCSQTGPPSAWRPLQGGAEGLHQEWAVWEGVLEVRLGCPMSPWTSSGWRWDWAAPWAPGPPQAVGRECPGAHMRTYLYTSPKEMTLAFSSGSWGLLSKHLLSSGSWITENLVNSELKHKNMLKCNKKSLFKLDQVIE